MGDATRRKLQIPPWFIPYLEKHRIYELFHELARELVIQQPVDHVLFLKHVLYHAAKSRDVARVVLLAAPKINSVEVGKQLAQQTGQVLITGQYIMNCFKKNKERSELTPEQVAKSLAYLVRTENAYSNGWIMADCFRNDKEARALLQLGILPTHVFHLISPFAPDLTELIYCHVHEGWPEYRRTISRLRDAFKHNLHEVHIKKRAMHEIITEIMELSKIRKGIAPMKPRVLLIGPRGSGRKTQAKMLADSMKLVHIDFEYLLCQTWISETELGKKLRNCKDEVCFRSDLLTETINKRILESDCLENGYVLTNFPFSVTDFKYLDLLDTPPNRVVFLECDLKICKERIVNRRMNVHTGSVTYLPNQPENLMKKRLASHPKDENDIVDAEVKSKLAGSVDKKEASSTSKNTMKCSDCQALYIGQSSRNLMARVYEHRKYYIIEYYCEQYGSLRSYCGQTASVVNAAQPKRYIFESIRAIIARAPPACPPRDCTLEMVAHPSSSLASSIDTCCCSPQLSTVFDNYTKDY